MNYEEALSFIHSNFWQGSKPGLSRTQELLDKMGNPQNTLRFVHVAGTNGKGSFCAMLTEILIAAGYTVGTYTSPYILRFNERIKVNGIDIPDEILASLCDDIRPLTESMMEKPTEFELITAVAMAYFARQNCDIVVLECGMGGRLDSTNVIKTPCLSVITGISLDHTAFLGDTIEAIAREKAGIIKPRVPVLYCDNDKKALAVIKEKAKEKAAPLHTIDRERLVIHEATLNGTRFSWKEHKDFFLPLLGSYQPKNARNVLQAVALLRNQGFSITEEHVKIGLSRVRWPARFELVSHSPRIICDGGHNPEGVDVAIESTKMYFGEEKLLLITGVMADKDYGYMASRMAEIAQEVYCITPENPRALNADDYAAVFLGLGIQAKGYASPLSALQAATSRAIAEGRAILCLGSLYMYGDIIKAIKAL